MGNENGPNGRKGKGKQLVCRKRLLAGNVEGLYIGKEQETLKEEGKQSVKEAG